MQVKTSRDFFTSPKNIRTMKIKVKFLLATVFSMVAFNRAIAQEADSASAIHFQKIPRVVLDVREGEDGFEEDRAAPGLKTSVPGNLPARAKLWNNRAFLKQANVNIRAEDTGITAATAAASDVCAKPIVEEGLESVYAGVRAHMPLYLPYRNSRVAIWQGFYYNWGSKHGAIDYGKTGIDNGEDPTFNVYAVAGGTVVDVGWSNSGGNFVVIEHTAPNGYKYRSTYIHLRNGFSHDLQKARNVPETSDKLKKYKKFANRQNPSKLCWGTESQKIAVKKNQKVKAGQFLACAGNTGSGGIGIILNDDGTLENPDTRSFNVHLHFKLAVKDTRPGKTGWVNIDPYGVYNKKSGIDCYDLEEETPFERLFAPFYPNFHNIPLDLVNQYWGYYTGMGMALQTFSISRNNGKLLASGSFQWGLPGAWYARFYMTGEKYQQYFDEYSGKGFRPRQIQVTKDGNGKPRFSVIWEKRPAGQQSFAFHNRTDANFSDLWDEYVKTKKWHVGEHVNYNVDGKQYHAGIFVNKPQDNGFRLYYGLSAADFNKKFDELADKWQLISMNVNGNDLGGVWRPKKKNYAAYFGLTPSGYQNKFDQLGAQGMKLFRVQSYDGGNRFAAIWIK